MPGLQVLPGRVIVALAATCLVSAVSYAGAVRMLALGAAVLPAAAICVLLSAVLMRWGGAPAGLLIGLPVAVGLAEGAHLVLSTGQGPVGRAVLVTGSGCVLAVVAAGWLLPSAVLMPVSGIVVGSLALGAGGEVRIVAVVASAAALLTLAIIERAGGRWIRPPRRRVSLIALVVLSAVIAVGAALFQGQHDARRPAVLAADVAHSLVRPPWKDPLPNPRATPHSRGARVIRVPARRQATPPARRSRSLPWAALGLALAAAAAGGLLLLMARLVFVQLAWRRFRRRMRAGPPALAVIGAWRWSLAQLTTCGMQYPAWLSPDGVQRGDGSWQAGLPDALPSHLRSLAAMTVGPAFDQTVSVGAPAAALAWREADELSRAAVAAADPMARLRALVRRPPK
jgi:hypothetical protein